MPRQGLRWVHGPDQSIQPRRGCARGSRDAPATGATALDASPQTTPTTRKGQCFSVSVFQCFSKPVLQCFPAAFPPSHLHTCPLFQRFSISAFQHLKPVLLSWVHGLWSMVFSSRMVLWSPCPWSVESDCQPADHADHTERPVFQCFSVSVFQCFSKPVLQCFPAAFPPSHLHTCPLFQRFSISAFQHFSVSAFEHLNPAFGLWSLVYSPWPFPVR